MRRGGVLFLNSPHEITPRCFSGFATLRRSLANSAVASSPEGETRVDVTFSGGHNTVGEDRGRPVVLIAAALNVPDQVFREAFKKVKPAPAGEQPQEAQVWLNK
jgi:hypothetical protein